MKRILEVFGVILIGIFVVVGILAVCKEAGQSLDQPIDIFEPQAVTDSDPSFVVCLDETGNLAADTAYLLIDLSDTTLWPHSDTATVLLRNYRLQGTVSGAHEWHLSLGVVTENDSTNGTAEFVAQKMLVSVSGVFDSDHHWANPLDMWIEDDSLLYVSTSMTETTTTWQNDAAITATINVTGFVAAGDIVLLVDEITSGSTVDFGICVEYDTR